MPIDPSIALGVRPLEVPNQLNQFAQMSQIQNAQNQNALAQYQLAAAQRAENQQNALAQALPDLDLSSAEGQRKLLGFGAPGLQILKTHRELEAQRATQKAQEATTLVKNLEAVDKTTARFKDDLVNVTTPNGAVEWLARQYQDPILGPVVGKMPFAQAVQQIPTEPKAFEEWRKRNNMGMEKYLTDTRAELNRLETSRHNLATERTAAGQLATSQGQLAIAQQKFAWEKANPGYELKEDANGNFYGVNKRTLEATPVTIAAPAAGAPAAGAPAAGVPEAGAPGAPLQGKGQALTEAQAKAVGFAARAKEADQILNTTTFKPLAVATKQGLESVYGIGGGLGMVANQMMSPNDQKVDQAQRNFVNAVLRQESGAAISEAEFENARRQYFPQPGDSKAVIKQKADNRQTVIKSLETVAGPGMRKAGATTPPTTPTAPAAPAVGSVQSGYRFKGGDPADAANWEKL